MMMSPTGFGHGDHFDSYLVSVLALMRPKMANVAYLCGETPCTLRARKYAVYIVVRDGSRWAGLELVAFVVKVNFTLILEVPYLVVHHPAPFWSLCCQTLPLRGLYVAFLHVSLLDIFVPEELPAMFPLALLQFRIENALRHSLLRHT